MSDYYNLEEYEYTYYDDGETMYRLTSMYIELCLYPLFLLIGTVGNILCMVILHRLSKEVSATCCYLCLLALMDLLVLCMRCGNDWLAQIAQIHLSNAMMMNSRSVCKVYPFLFNFLFHMSRWLVVCVAVEGAISVKRPDNAVHCLTRQRAQATMLLLTVILICLNIHYFWSFDLSDEIQDMGYIHLSGKMCTFIRHGHHHSETFVNKIWPVIDSLVSEMLPTIIGTICIVIMARKICRGEHRGNQEHQAWKSRYMMDPCALDQTKVAFLVLCITFLPAVLPKFTFNITKYLIETAIINGTDTAYAQSKMEFAHIMCSTLEYAFLSFKIILYAATISKFRRELKLLVKCPCWMNITRWQAAPASKTALVGESLSSGDSCCRDSIDHHSNYLRP